jgi:hypothetical protein
MNLIFGFAYLLVTMLQLARMCRQFDAVELYCKANHHMEASHLLVELAKQSAERRVSVSVKEVRGTVFRLLGGKAL